MNAQSQVVQFQFNNNQVRTVVKDEQVWFVASDVCKALDYANPSDAVATHLDDDEKMTIANSDSHSGKRGGSRLMVIINESGLYALVLRSRKPEARKFAKWVTSEVLPSIRKTGSYSLPKPSTKDDRTPLKNTVNWAVHKTGLSHSDVYTMVHNYFGVESVSDLTEEQIPQAVKYLCEVVTTPANQPTLTEILPSTRYLLTKAHNGLGYLLQPIAPDANMVHDNDIAFHIENNMPRLSVEALASIITACTKRMQQRMEWSEMRIKSLKKDNPQLGFFA